MLELSPTHKCRHENGVIWRDATNCGGFSKPFSNFYFFIFLPLLFLMFILFFESVVICNSAGSFWGTIELILYIDCVCCCGELSA
eukprot:UN00328